MNKNQQRKLLADRIECILEIHKSLKSNEIVILLGDGTEQKDVSKVLRYERRFIKVDDEWTLR